MKKITLTAMMLLLVGLTSAEAKKEGNGGKSNHAVTEAGDKGKEHHQHDDKKAKKPEAEKAQVAGKEKSDAAKHDPDEMKAAVAEKKEAQKAAKKSGEKLDKEKKSAWKFWKK